MNAYRPLGVYTLWTVEHLEARMIRKRKQLKPLTYSELVI